MVRPTRSRIHGDEPPSGNLVAKDAECRARSKERRARRAGKGARGQAEPKPPPRVPEIPKWAGSGGDPITGIGTGVTYTGPPSVVPTGDGVSWVKERRANGDWKDPFGQWRYASGELIPRTIEPQPIGPDRDPKHQQDVELLDRIVGNQERQ